MQMLADNTGNVVAVSACTNRFRVLDGIHIIDYWMILSLTIDKDWVGVKKHKRAMINGPALGPSMRV